MNAVDSIPAALRSRLDGVLDTGSVRLAVVADLSAGRAFGRSAVAMDAQRLAVVGEEGEPFTSELSAVKELKVEELFGSCCLTAVFKQPEGAQRRLVYYTHACVPEVAAFCRMANDLLAGRTPREGEPVKPMYCPKCGGPLAERGGTCPACVPRIQIIRRLLTLMQPYRGKVAALVLLTFAGVGVQLGPPYVTKVLVDDIIRTGHFEKLGFWIAVLALLATAFLLTRLASGYLSAWLAARIVTDLRARMHAHVQWMKLSYFNRRESGEIIGRVMQDAASLEHFLIDGFPFLLVNVILFIGIAAMLLWLNAALALLVFLPVPFLLLGGRWFYHRIHPLFHHLGTVFERLNTILGESVNGIRVVKAFSRQKLRSDMFARAGEEAFRSITFAERSFLVFREGMFWVMQIGVAAVWYFGARQIGEGGPASAFTLGTLMAFVGYIWLFYGPIQWFSVIFNWMTRSLASAERIFALLDSPGEKQEDPAAARPPRLKGGIEFREVRFSYERGKEVLKGISFRIEPGEMVGLVGKSGAGKSTLINLISRFWDPDSGAVLVDGQDLREIDVSTYRRQVGVVMQDPFLFNCSLLENIRFGMPEASFEDVVRAAQAAHAHEFILGKEDGYDTVVGEKGAELSGGERQRIAIARAVLHDPPILILDEATSSVDLETEKKIQEAITRLVRGRTTIAIAHRLSTLRNANRLIVMDDGAIAEMGTHDELVAKADGMYAKLVKTQSEVNAMRGQQRVWGE
jgi:ATP-binding cassette subfamily B protein